MTKSEMFCHKYYAPERCAGYHSGTCSTCYCYDIVDIGYCDCCGAELDDENFYRSEKQELCPDCVKKLKGDIYEFEF